MERYNDILDLEENEMPPIIHADFGNRLMAHIIDNLILSVGFFTLTGFLGLMVNNATLKETDFFDLMIGLVVIFGAPVFFLAYHAIFESSTYRGTPGKLLLRIQVSDLQGNPISFWHSVGRNAGKFLSAFILYIGFFMAIWTPKKQTLHDSMANTLVILRNTRPTSIKRSDKTV